MKIIIQADPGDSSQSPFPYHTPSRGNSHGNFHTHGNLESAAGETGGAWKIVCGKNLTIEPERNRKLTAVVMQENK